MLMFLKIETFNGCQLLLDDLNVVINRATPMGLEFNVDRCHYMSFYRMSTPIDVIYSAHLLIFILFDRELTFHSHIESSCCKALIMFGFVWRVCS